MSKQHSQGEGVKLVGSPKELVNFLINDSRERKYALNHIVNEGPVHKQVLNALLLKRAYKLIQVIEKSSGTPFVLQSGYEFSIESEDEETVLPVEMPVNTSAGTDPQKIADAVAHAPEHELLVYTMCLQVIEWAVKAAAKTNVTDN